MVLAVLWACTSGGDSGGAAAIDVSVAPAFLSITLDAEAMYCANADTWLWEPMGFVYVVNSDTEYIQVDAVPTHTFEDVWQPKVVVETWMDVSVVDEAHRNLEPGAQMEIELYAMGHCFDGGTALDRFKHYRYPVQILLADAPTLVEGEIVLTPRG